MDYFKRCSLETSFFVENNVKKKEKEFFYGIYNLEG